jgi:trehalose 6-phosphate synthase/phosphatase
MPNLIIVSNRLPITAGRDGSGRVTVRPGSGGLATAVGSISKRLHARWVGYLGNDVPADITAAANAEGYFPVQISQPLYENYYNHFSNRVLWPVVHGFAAYDAPESYWEDYRAVNELFAKEVARIAAPDDIIWVHDFHLLMVPKLLREAGLTNRIGFFLHTPFPANFFHEHPLGRRLLAGLLEADSIGLQTKRSLSRFRSSLRRLGLRAGGVVKAFPIGIDFKFFSRRPALAPEFYEQVGPKPDVKMVLSLSRLDYTKGILQQLAAIKQLAARPGLAGTFAFRLLVVPSRDTVPEYRALKTEIDRQVAAVNAAAGDWQPIIYTYGAVDTDTLKATYRRAGIMLVTPLADGMNLVAKEYLAANARGTLILSREAGAAEQLSDALIVDPTDPAEIAATIEHALSRPASAAANRRLRSNLRRYDVFNWAESFLRSLQPKAISQLPLVHPALNQAPAEPQSATRP